MVGWLGVSLGFLGQGEILVRNGMEGRLVHHVHHHGGNAGWVALGAAAVGAVVGGLIGAAAR